MPEKKIFILPGEVAVSRQPATISTLLGSCVSICLYSRELKAGGMNHFMLPTGENENMKGKYGDYATGKLVEMMRRLGSNSENLEARIYGGGSVVGHLDSGMSIGPKNILMAERLMAQYRIPIKRKEVGGNNGRKIFFNTETGEVDVKIIEKSQLSKQLESKKKSMAGRKIRVLVVDDSATIRRIITRALELDPEIEVVGDAKDAYHAREMVLRLDPDVLTLDIIMPKMDGMTFLKKLMIHFPKPIIIVSSIAQKESRQRMRALDMGAVKVVDKEDLKLYQGLETVSGILTKMVRSAAVTHVEKKTIDEIGRI